jgi:DNA-binding protein HU-beta
MRAIWKFTAAGTPVPSGAAFMKSAFGLNTSAPSAANEGFQRMTKNNLVEYVASNTQRTRKEAEQAIDAMLEGIAEALGRGEKVELRGFGSFQVSDKKERQGRNPRTGETMTIAARKAAAFKPGKELADRINGAESGSAEPSEGPAKMHGDKIKV